MALDKLDFENWSSAGRDEAQSVNIEVSLSLLKEAEQQQQTIDSSIKILNILKNERRSFNASSKKKVSLKDLKNIFFDSEQNYPKESEYSKEEWGLASVNARLKNNLEKDAIPFEENLKFAKDQIKSHNVTSNVKSLEELYIGRENKLDFRFSY
tara:strand:- start:776 stop:1237 length:462 start_codon:yes stop_codon:yes gene_type:complete